LLVIWRHMAPLAFCAGVARGDKYAGLAHADIKGVGSPGRLPSGSISPFEGESWRRGCYNPKVRVQETLLGHPVPGGAYTRRMSRP